MDSTFPPVQTCYIKGHGEHEDKNKSGLLRVPISEMRPAARCGGALRMPSVEPFYKINCVRYSTFPASGVVMVKCPDHMNEPYWPARIISLSEYDEIYAESRFVDLPGKKELAVIIYLPSWSKNLMELKLVPANSHHLQPFHGVEKALSSSTFFRYDMVNENGSTPAVSSMEEVSALRRAKRRLVSAYFVADALHRTAWMLCAVQFHFKNATFSPFRKTKCRSMAHYEVAEYPTAILQSDCWSRTLLDDGLADLDQKLGITSHDWQSVADSDFCRTVSQCNRETVFDLSAIIPTLKVEHRRVLATAKVPYGADAWSAYSGTLLLQYEKNLGPRFSCPGSVHCDSTTEALRLNHFQKWASLVQSSTPQYREVQSIVDSHEKTRNLHPIVETMSEDYTRSTKMVSRPPQPTPGEPLQYTSFIHGHKELTFRANESVATSSGEPSYKKPKVVEKSSVDAMFPTSRDTAVPFLSTSGRVLPNAATQPWWTSGEELLNRRISILWNRKNVSFYQGVISSYDDAKKLHTVRFDDGDTREYSLDKKIFKLGALTPDFKKKDTYNSAWIEYECIATNVGSTPVATFDPSILKTPTPTALCEQPSQNVVKFGAAGASITAQAIIKADNSPVSAHHVGYRDHDVDTLELLRSAKVEIADLRKQNEYLKCRNNSLSEAVSRFEAGDVPQHAQCLNNVVSVPLEKHLAMLPTYLKVIDFSDEALRASMSMSNAIGEYMLSTPFDRRDETSSARRVVHELKHRFDEAIDRLECVGELATKDKGRRIDASFQHLRLFVRNMKPLIQSRYAASTASPLSVAHGHGASEKQASQFGVSTQVVALDRTDAKRKASHPLESTATKMLSSPFSSRHGDVFKHSTQFPAQHNQPVRANPNVSISKSSQVQVQLLSIFRNFTVMTWDDAESARLLLNIFHNAESFDAATALISGTIVTHLNEADRRLLATPISRLRSESDASELKNELLLRREMLVVLISRKLQKLKNLMFPNSCNPETTRKSETSPAGSADTVVDLSVESSVEKASLLVVHRAKPPSPKLDSVCDAGVPAEAYSPALPRPTHDSRWHPRSQLSQIFTASIPSVLPSLSGTSQVEVPQKSENFVSVSSNTRPEKVEEAPLEVTGRSVGESGAAQELRGGASERATAFRFQAPFFFTNEKGQQFCDL